MITKNFNSMRKAMFYAKSKMQNRKCNKILRKIKEKIMYQDWSLLSLVGDSPPHFSFNYSLFCEHSLMKI